MAADRATWLRALVAEMNRHWPNNRAHAIVCHGHSVPAGYFATPFVDTFNAYPHLLHRALKDRFPYAVVNVIVTAIGGEGSEAGAARFSRDVLSVRPDVVTIDYGLNDRGLGLERAGRAWRGMIEQAIAADAKPILVTPTPDVRGWGDRDAEPYRELVAHAEQIRRLADEYAVGLADSFAAFETYAAERGDVTDLMAWVNHPNRAGHEIVARELMRWFAIREL